jgi:hypothetical protein
VRRPFGQSNDLGRRPTAGDLPDRQQSIPFEGVDRVDGDHPATNSATVEVDAYQ